MNRFAGLYSLILIAFAANGVFAESVDWNGPSGSRIKQIRYLAKAAAAAPETRSAAAAELSAGAIDSPPIDGFVPWIVVTATDRNAGEDDWAAYTENTLRGSFPYGVDYHRDYFIGIFDTGASAHVIGFENAARAGLFSSTYLTQNMTVITGVTGSVDAWVSRALAIYMDGLDALEPNSPSDPEAVLPSLAGMMGESNVSVIVGDDPGSYPDLNTAIGSPMSVYYVTQILNSAPVSVIRNGRTFNAPTLRFYSIDDETAPHYPNRVPLELRPLGAVNVQYTISLDIFNPEFVPASPSVIIGNSSQSLFFVHSVDLTEGVNAAMDKSRFMLDTGAQITVIGSRIAARLGLNPVNKEFEVEIEGVTGESIMAPGFIVDSMTIPAIGDWLEFTNVPVILLDIYSPEGGTLDGIIGMNLFTQFDLILRGGGIFLQDDPVLEFQRISTGSQAGDIAPATGDSKVDLQDLSVFSSAWLSDTSSANWNPDADLAPTPGDGVISMPDLMVIADNWLAGVAF